MQFKAIWWFFILIGLSCQLPQNTEPPTTTTANDASNHTAGCTSARGLKGVCIGRERCDYGTKAIDFLLYAPKGYRQPCPTKEVCCPLEYILVQEPFDKEMDVNFDE